MLLIVPEFKPTETTLKHLMCFLVFIYGSKRGNLGCISAAQQSMLLKTDVARARMESKAMISMFMLFSCAGYSISVNLQEMNATKDMQLSVT